MRSKTRIAALASSICTIGALILASAGLAGQPVAQTLNPPPQPWQTCRAAGEGTICEGTISFAYGPDDTFIACGSGSSAFHILDSATESERATRFYDANGNLVRRVRHVRFTSGRLSNSLTGATLDYTQSQTWTDVLAVPGDPSSATTMLTGELVVSGAGGGPVLIGAGRTVFGPGFSVEFQAGPSGFVDFLAGDPETIDRLCAALAAA